MTLDLVRIEDRIRQVAEDDAKAVAECTAAAFELEAAKHRYAVAVQAREATTARLEDLLAVAGAMGSAIIA